MFKLTDNFLTNFKHKKPNWGPLGEITYKRTYSRPLENGKMEEWWQTIQRVVEGVYNIQEQHCKQLRLPWSASKAQRSAQEMYTRMFEMKFLPPGRGLWAMGTPLVTKLGSAALFNCAFTSTKDIKADFSDPFCFLMDMSMLGVGVGFDTLGAGTVSIREPKKGNAEIVEDSREGWVALVCRVLDAYGDGGTLPSEIDYSQVRPEGTPLKTFGGIASGPGPLITCVKEIQDILNPMIGKEITSETIVDLMNVIGKCVVSGNIRRSAELAIGQIDDELFLNLKNKETNSKQLYNHRWASNNSVFAEIGSNYSKVANLTASNGEPGYIWMENTRSFGRMGDTTYGDYRCMGYNPSLRAGTKMYTSDGIKNIEELEGKSFKVRNLNGETVEAECWLSGKNKPLTEIVLDNGQSYFATQEHKWPIYTPQGYIKCETSDLKPGHMIPIKQFSDLEFGNLGTYQDGFLIGWLYGDGNLTVRSDNNKNQYNLVVGHKDDGIADILMDKIHQITQGNQQWVKKESTLEFATTNKLLDEFMQKFEVSKKENGLPKSIWTTASESFRKGFIDALYSSDGTIEKAYKTAKIRITQSNKKIIDDLRELLGFYGIKTTTHCIRIKNAIFPNKKEYNREYVRYALDIARRESISHFKTLFTLTHKKKNLLLTSITPLSVIHPLKGTHLVVKNIIPSKIFEDCWDVSVKDTTHCFQLAFGMTGNCVEQPLEDHEMCCLCESFPSRHDSYEDYERTLKFAYLYGKTVTLIPTHNERTNAVIMRNRRIGLSQSGIVQNFQKIGKREHFKWCDQGYKYVRELDAIYSDWLCIPKSVKVTTVKPSGTVSLLPGVTPGVHYPHSEYYLRTIRFSSTSTMLQPLKDAGYRIEKDKYSPNTMVVYFPVHEEYFDRAKTNVTMWEQLENTAQMQKWWSDNGVSATITFNSEEAKDIKNALELYETRLKAISFLPLEDHGYEQAPYQEISQAEYEKYTAKLLKIKWKNIEHEITDSLCDGETCVVNIT